MHVGVYEDIGDLCLSADSCLEGWCTAIFVGWLLEGRNADLFHLCGSDCHLCIQNSCVHQLDDWCREVRNFNGMLISKVVHI